MYLKKDVNSHCLTMYIDMAYCYRPSSVVCKSDCRFVTLVSSAKMTQLIQTPFGFRTWSDLQGNTY